jgi:(E)-4-hydroxy-3-methylbut-2-enyl-diphosphate synthase
MIHRNQTRPVQVGGIQIGGNDRIVIQSMTNTKTKDIDGTVSQVLALEKAGCELVRFAVLDSIDALAIREIKKRIHIPVVADIHFDHRLALVAIEAGADKIRINPGNIGKEENVRILAEACRAKHIPIRIGINSGSLEPGVLAKYGHPTPEAMVESAKNHVALLEKFDFRDIVLSLKSTDLEDTLRANERAAEVFPYPLHLGLTEAGTAFGGTIKSAIGLGTMIREGLGSTLRVSLSADPVEEIAVAKEILAPFGLFQKPRLISCPTCGRIQYDMIPIAVEIEKFLSTSGKNITVAVMGCAVTGPGEAKEADLAWCGGREEALLFIDGVPIRKVPQSECLEVLKKAIIDYPER